MKAEIRVGDCREVMAAMPENSIEAIVTDPPYGLEFMGKEWDKFKTYSGGNPSMKPKSPTVGESSGASYGFRQKNPRCRRCGKLLRGNGCCKCPEPQIDTRTSEGGNQFQFWVEDWASALLRVARPGAHLLAFGGTRTFHRLTCAIEDAGWEVRDCLMWLYGSGFPKSLDVSKAIDKARHDNADVDVVRAWLTYQVRASSRSLGEINAHFGHSTVGGGSASSWTTNSTSKSLPTWDQWVELKHWLGFSDEMDAEVWRLNGRKGQPSEEYASRPDADYTSAPGMRESWTDGSGWTGTASKGGEPVRDAAKQWAGWGTALKPAWEPIVLARKPLIGTVSQNVQTHGTGAINVDACRIGTERTHATRNTALGRMNDDGWQARPQVHDAIGRWPANVALDEDAARQLDEQSGETVSGTAIRRNLPDEGGSQKINFKARTARGGDVTFGDSGGASRFFYTSKASQTDRDRDMGNRHPTVKPVDLMRWLVRLVTPPGGTVLDPFAGSGSTGVAALGEGFNFIGIELDAEYAAIAKARLESVAPMFAEVTAR